MRAELIGRRGAPMLIFTVKRLSGRTENGSERFGLGASRRDGESVETLDCVERVGFERRSSGSAGGRTALEAIVAIASKMNFIIMLDQDLRVSQLFSLTVCL